MDLQNLLSSASGAHASGRLEECAAFCGKALDLDPHNVQALLLMGVTEAKIGDPIKAIELLEEVQRSDQTSFQAPFWLSVTYRKLGQRTQAVQAAERAVTINEKDPQAQAQLGLCYLDARLLPEAETRLRTAHGMAPNVIQIQCSLGNCLRLQGRKQEALSLLVEAADKATPTESALLKLGNLLLGEGNALGAVEFGRRAVATFPNSANARLLLARALMEDNLVGWALEHLQIAVKLEPASAEMVAVLGNAYQALGDIDQASSLFRQSLQLNPNQGSAYFALFYNRKVTERDRSEITRMQELAVQESLPPQQLSYLHYGLAKAHENLAEYETSMGHYDEANRIEYGLHSRCNRLDRQEYAGRTERTISIFSKKAIATYGTGGSKSDLPIFVVGMMRSGTTLVEQILSSHPGVGAGGEQSFWPDNWRQAMDEAGTSINPPGLTVLADRYCAMLKEIAHGKNRVVDKLPGNTFGLGVIHLALPDARIIHTRRHPVDTCLSIYATPNRAHPEFAHNRENIVLAYRQYLRIMEHWRSALPPGTILEVDYEELVTDGERITRKMIEFCGLEWNDSCLKPQDNVRSVVTPSVWQVRQPIYTTSMERWRKFEPWLGSFCELL